MITESQKELASGRLLRYLKAFGYIVNTITDLRSVSNATIQQAQDILSIPQSGVVDDATIKAIDTVPRCGHHDRESLAGGQAATINQWLKSRACGPTGLSYHIIKYVDGPTSQEQEQQIAAAFAAWESITTLRIVRKRSTDADIIIDASASRQEEFGTAGNVLAWAYLPQGASWTGQLIMKFDLAERWGSAINLQIVACHEIGHLLGLSHTSLKGQLMYPTYNEAIASPQWGYDVEQAQTRYGVAAQQPPNDPTIPPGTINPFDKSVITYNGKFYKIVPM